jgi:DegV family protein with EDD domain
MNDFLIATASTADVPFEYLKKHQIPFIGYTYTVDGQVFEDDCRELTRQNAYQQMRQGAIYATSMINAWAYHEFFKSLMDTGKNVIYLDMSREMSSSYVAAQQAAEQIREEYPNQRFYAMDTRCISGGLGLLLEHMVLRKEQGMNFDEVSRGARPTSSDNAPLYSG